MATVTKASLPKNQQRTAVIYFGSVQQPEFRFGLCSDSLAEQSPGDGDDCTPTRH
ncbi:MAG TPA: hypothetical protein V6D09_21690 [Leptolyngbyaceae cyanobacterium]